MTKSILLSDEEEGYITEICHANLKGLDVHDVVHGPSPTGTRTRAVVVGLMRKLGLEVPDAPQDPFADGPHEVREPGHDLARMAAEMQTALQPMMRELSPGRVERVAGPLFIKLVIANGPGWLERTGTMNVRNLATDAIEAARIFLAAMDEAVKA